MMLWLLIVSMLACCDCVSSFVPMQVPDITETRQQVPIFVRQHTTCLFAKKKKKKKKKANDKKSGFEWASSFTLKPFEAKATRELAAMAISSFEGRTGKPLAEELKGVADLPKALWNAPVACLVVNDGDNESCTVAYANVAALETVGLQPHEFEQLISDSDGTGDRFEINLPCQMKADKKYESEYGKKILKRSNGEDVTILDAHRWLLEKSALVDGKFVTEPIAVAYAWKEWMLGDSTVCSPGGQQREVINEDDLEQAVQDQAAAVRELKEVQGLGNKDPQVAEAVQELLRLKSLLADVESK